MAGGSALNRGVARAQGNAPAGMSRMVRALRYRNYRLFFGGQLLSLIGTWLQQVALSWLVFRLTGSALLLGVVGFSGQIPSFLLAPFAGVLIDRWNRRRVLLITQTLAMIQAVLLGLLVLFGHIEDWHIMVMAALLGIVNSFDLPARQTFVAEIVEDRADLPNAIALNSSMFNGARLVGPAVAGLMVATVGEAWCFLLNGASYLFVLAALALTRVESPTAAPSHQNVLESLREGAGYAWGFTPIRALLLLLGTISLVGMPYTVLMPVFATRILGGNATTQGLLMAASGLGALGSALYLASRHTVVGLGRVIVLGVLLFGGGLVAFSASRSLWFSLPVMVVTGAGMMLQMAASNTVLQTIVSEDKRGRVMSLYTMAFMGTAPFGSLLAGSVSAQIGAPLTLGICGTLAIAAGLLFARVLPALRELVRPLYVEAGILPAAAAGVHNATQLTRFPETR